MQIVRLGIIAEGTWT